MPPPRTTRTVGIAVLVIAGLVLFLAGPLTHRGVTGRPTLAAVDAAPTPGQCIDETDTEPVDCAQPHTAQIVQAWHTWDRHVTSSDLGELKRDCWDRGQETLQPLGLARNDPYAGPIPPTRWAPPPLVVDTDIVTSNPDTSPQPWVACVVKPRSAVTPDINAPLAPVGAYTGTIDTLVPLAVRPLNLRSCYELSDRLPATINCRSWHRGEVLATRTSTDRPTSDDDIACRAIAVDLLGTDDPTRGGLLQTRVDTRPADGQINRLPADQQTLTLMRCVVEASGGKFLTDSVIGLGDNPPPTN